MTERASTLMQIANPLPVFVCIPLMATFCWLLSRWLPILDDITPAHAKTLPLDGLRGILASAVLFQHAYINYIFVRTGEWYPEGSMFYGRLGPTAVTMFFFISGYLFWRKMLRDPSSVSTRQLIPNRIRRIMPAYLAAVLLFFLFVAWKSGFHIVVPLRQLTSEITSWILGGFPVLGGPALNQVDPLSSTGGVFWTLQEEWIFYFVLPLLTWFRPIRRLFPFVIVLYLAGRLLFHVPSSSKVVGEVFYVVQKFIHMFAFGFVFGMLAAYKINVESVNRVLRSPWMTPVAAILLGTELFFSPRSIGVIAPLLLLPIFLMIVAGNDFLGLLSSSPLRCLGAVSYSLYVFHGLLLRIMVTALDGLDPIRSMPPLTYWLCIVPISLLIVLWSTLSYKFIERPFFAPRRIL